MPFEDELTRTGRAKYRLKETGTKVKGMTQKGYARGKVIGRKAGSKAKEQIGVQKAKLDARREEQREIKAEAQRVYKEERKKVLTERAIAKAKQRAKAPGLGEQIGKLVSEGKKRTGKAKKAKGVGFSGVLGTGPKMDIGLGGISSGFELGSGPDLGLSLSGVGDMGFGFEGSKKKSRRKRRKKKRR